MINRFRQRFPWINVRTVTLAGLAIVVAVGLYANALLDTGWPLGEAEPAGAYLSASGTKKPSSTPSAKKAASQGDLPDLSGNAIEDLRNERERARELELKTLDGILSDKNASDETKKEAEALMLSIASFIEREATTESLLRGKGFNDIAVTIREGSVYIVLGGGKEPGEGDIAKILDVAVKETGQAAKNINVMTAK